MVLGAKSKLGAPMFEPEVFQKQMCCIEKSTFGIVGTFRHPSVIDAPIVIRHLGYCALLVSLIMSLVAENMP